MRILLEWALSSAEQSLLGHVPLSSRGGLHWVEVHSSLIFLNGGITAIAHLGTLRLVLLWYWLLVWGKLVHWLFAEVLSVFLIEFLLIFLERFRSSIQELALWLCLHRLNYLAEESVLISRHESLILLIILGRSLGNQRIHTWPLAGIFLLDLSIFSLDVILLVLYRSASFPFLRGVVSGEVFDAEERLLLLLEAERGRNLVVRVHLVVVED